jgi:hypothetical protein
VLDLFYGTGGFLLSFKEHGLPLYLSPPLYLGLIKLQADKGLGKSYAGLLAFVEGLHKLGYLSDSDYEVHVKRYSRGLAEQENQPLPLERLNAKKELEKKAKIFSMVLDQWAEHPDIKWRQKWIAEAEKWKNKIPTAKLVLDLAIKEESF